MKRTCGLQAVAFAFVLLCGTGNTFAQEPDPSLRVPDPARTNLRSWNDAADLLRSRSTDLRIAVGEVSRADAQTRVALAALLPGINGNLTLAHQFIVNQGSQVCKVDGQNALCPIEVPQQNTLDGSLSASMPLVHLRAWYNIGTTRRVTEAAKLSVDDAKRTILLAVVSSMISVFTTERIAELNRIGLQNALDRKDLAVKRKELLSGTGLDVIRASQDVEAARATVVTGNESLRQARESLGLALGVPEPIGVSRELDLRSLEGSAKRVCVEQGSIEGRADIAALKARAALAERAHTDVELQFLPILSASSNLSTTSRDTAVAPRTTWDVRGLLTWNIWDGGARYGGLRDTSAQREQAEMRLEAGRRRATIEVAQARRSVTVADESRTIAELARDLAKETDRLTRLAFTEGRGTSLELITAATALRQSEVQLALREFEWVRARLLATLATAVCSF
jgi:outer membrane protein, multidrug efflux system